MSKGIVVSAGVYGVLVASALAPTRPAGSYSGDVKHSERSFWRLGKMRSTGQ